jgi:hypothetical protein
VRRTTRLSNFLRTPSQAVKQSGVRGPTSLGSRKCGNVLAEIGQIYSTSF